MRCGRASWGVLWVAALLAAAGCQAAAQDTRTVTEPVIPPSCVRLEAALATAGHGHSGLTLAAADEDKLDTERIQKAMDGCAPGHAVELAVAGGSNAFLSGPLHLRSGVVLRVDAGVTLFASRDAAVFAKSPGSCGLVNDEREGCYPLLSADHVTGAGVMGEGTIDGRGGEAILNAPHGGHESWWQLAEDARSSGRQQCFRLLVTNHADDFTLYEITLKNSPNFHVVYNDGNGFTVWGLKIDTPQRGARNTDGVDPGDGSRNITITHSWIRTGDDNVALKGGKGGIRNVTVAHNHFYWGHGMSIGSETYGGVSAIRVTDLSLDGADNGIRIKSNGSRGGLTEDVVYDDVCVRDSPHPITLDTGYSAAGTLTGDRPPTMKDITLHDVRVSGGGQISFNGYAHEYRVQANLDDVLLTDGARYKYSIHHADLRLGPGPVNLNLSSGVDSTVAGTPGQGKPESCAAKFVAWPKP